MSFGKCMFLRAKSSGTSPYCLTSHSGMVSLSAISPLLKAASMILFIALPVTPAFFSFSVLAYTPVRVPPPLPVCCLYACCSPVFCGAASTSGWTTFILVLNSCGFPKNTHSVPGFSFSNIHLMPLKNTISISPVPSDTHTLILLTRLNLSPSCWLWSRASPRAEELAYRFTRMTLARICT